MVGSNNTIATKRSLTFLKRTVGITDLARERAVVTALGLGVSVVASLKSDINSTIAAGRPLPFNLEALVITDQAALVVILLGDSITIVAALTTVGLNQSIAALSDVRNSLDTRRRQSPTKVNLPPRRKPQILARNNRFPSSEITIFIQSCRLATRDTELGITVGEVAHAAKGVSIVIKRARCPPRYSGWLHRHRKGQAHRRHSHAASHMRTIHLTPCNRTANHHAHTADHVTGNNSHRFEALDGLSSQVLFGLGQAIPATTLPFWSNVDGVHD